MLGQSELAGTEKVTLSQIQVSIQGDLLQLELDIMNPDITK